MRKDTKKVIHVVPDTSTAPKRVYANVIFVNSSKHDFTLTFSDFIFPLDHEIDKDSDEQFVLAPVVARIGLNPELIPDFIKALEHALKSYNEQWGQKK